MYYVMIITLIAADQVIKFLVRSNMAIGESLPMIEGALHLTHVSNSGAAFSILQGQTTLLTIVPAVMIAALLGCIYFYRKKGGALLLFSLSLICAGGAGNLIDRAARGTVTDYIDFRVFPVFNLADICVCCGCGLLVIYMILLDRKEKGGNGEG